MLIACWITFRKGGTVLKDLHEMNFKYSTVDSPL